MNEVNRRSGRCLRMLVVAGAVLHGTACGAVEPRNAGSPGSGPVAQGDSPSNDGSSSRSCQPNKPLSPEERRSRADEYQRIQASRSQAATAGDGTPACEAVREFNRTCPLWDINTRNVVAELCQERGHDSCVAGKPLDSSTRRDRTYHWKLILDARSNPNNGLLESACRFARDFDAHCSAWDPDTKKIAGEVCELAAKTCAPSMTASEKRAAAPGARQGVEAEMRTDLGLGGLIDPTSVRPRIAEVKRIARLAQCYDPEGTVGLAATVDAWADETEKAIQEEISCRASDECRARRIANQVCATMADKKEAQQQIATEKRNPGGVVSLRTLHDLGERVQYDDATIANLKTDYRSLAKKPFSEAACSR